MEDAPKIEHTFDIGNMPKVIHNWVERGDVVSCEGAGHPSHRHFKVRVEDVAE